jgi:hypothetical protein
MTSMVDATADFHYIYLAAAGTITDSATEPAWSDAKFGWYSGDTRCIGAVWVPSATPAVLAQFEGNIDHEYIYYSVINNPVSSGNPTGAWIDITTASTYNPVNSISALASGYNAQAASSVTVQISSLEMKYAANGLNLYGYQYIAGQAWITLGASRNLAWYGENDDNNTFNVNLHGYKLRI